MRPKTFVGFLGIFLVILSMLLEQSGGGDGTLVLLGLGIIVMAAAWLVRWPGDTDDARKTRRRQRDARVRRFAQYLRR